MKQVHYVRLVFRCAIMVTTLLFGLAIKTSEIKAATYTEKIDGATWSINVEDDGVVSITLESGDSIQGPCVIPEKVHGYTVNCIGEQAFAFKKIKGEKDVVIPDTISLIRKNAFQSCEAIQSVSIPDSVVTIEEGAFAGCTHLKYVKLPNNLTEISDRLFSGCSNLMTVECNTDASSNQVNTCSLSSAVEQSKEVVFPEVLRKIGEEAFSGCKKFQEIVIPKSVTEISSKAFKDCGIQVVVLPSELTDTQEDIFFGDHKLKDIYFMGTIEQWNATGLKRLAEVGFQYSDRSGYHITVHFYTPFLWKNPDSATYYLNDKSVVPLTIGATGKIDVGKNNSLVVPLSYQWYVNKEDNNVYGTAISGATSTEYLPPVNKAGECYYYCVVTSQFGCIQTNFASKTAKITVSEHEYAGGKDELDYSALQQAVNDARGRLDDAEYINRYTAESVQRYQDITDVAQEMIDTKSAASQEVINDKVIEVEDGRKLLIIKPEERPVPHIENGVADVTLHDEKLIIQEYVKGAVFNQQSIYKFEQDSSLMRTKATEIKEAAVTESGFYTFYVKDSYGDDYYLVVYYDSRLGVTSYFDLSELSYEILKAQELLDSIPVGKTGLGAGAAYTTQKAKDALLEAIDKATNSISSIGSQDDITNILQALRESESTFEKKIQKVLWVTIEVEGSTVRVLPMDNCRISRVQFNVDESGNLKQGIWGKWESMREEAWDKQDSGFEWKNVADGVYTFVITELDANNNVIWGLKTFTVSANSTKVAVTVDFMQEQIEKAEAIWNATPKASDAQELEVCVPDAIHKHFGQLIEETKQLLASPDKTFTTLVYKMFDLTAAQREFLASREPEKTISHDVDVSIDKGVISVDGKELYQCSFAKGDYKTEEEYQNANITTCKLTDGTGTMNAMSNGTYTICFIFKDDACIYKQIEVTDVLTAQESDGIITLSYAASQDVIRTRYAYDDGTDKLNYRTYSGLKDQIQALGNGKHVVSVTYADGEEDTLVVDVAGCTKPVIMLDDGKLAVYDYGFSLEVALYAKGHFTSWEEMYQDVYNIDQMNTPTDTKEFEKGEYTFYFQDKNGNVYFEYVTIE